MRDARARRQMRLLSLAKISPLLGLVLVAAVWVAAPPQHAVTLASYGGAYYASEIENSETASAYGLSLDESKGVSFFEDACRDTWREWYESLGPKPSAAARFSPSVLGSSSTASPSLARWEKANGARVWAWVTPPPEQPSVIASSTYLPGWLERVPAITAEANDMEASWERPRPRDLVSWLWSLAPPDIPDASGHYDDLRPTPRDKLGSPSSSFSEEGDDGYQWTLSGVTLAQGRQLWHALVAHRGTSADLRILDAVGTLKPTDPQFQADVDKLAREHQINIWVLGPLTFRAVPLRIPRSATTSEAAALGALLWPPKPANDAEPERKKGLLPLAEWVVPLSGRTAVLAGGSQAVWQVTESRDSDTDTESYGLFVAVYDKPPTSRWSAVWTSLRRFVWTWYQVLLGVAVGLLGITLVISPAAHIRERRLIARQRVFEDMERVRRDAHDRVYNRLSALSKRIASAAASDSDESTAALSTIAEDIRITVGDLQEILGEEVRHTSGALTTVPLAEQISSVCRAQAARLNIEVIYEPDEDLPGVDGRLGWDLQCIAEEAITNAVRHGKATRVVVSLAADERGLLLAVADNGSGSTVLSPDKAPSECTGLRSMGDRAGRHAGSLVIESSHDDGGTTVTARVPADALRHRHADADDT